MLQSKISFNQSNVSLEIIGLPDPSNNNNNDQISIISQWKLMIIDKPLIEGNVEHLRSIMNAFYKYSNFLINNELSIYESKLIDIKAVDILTHDILLKSSKPDVKPLNIKIGNAVLSDIINCFDQFNNSNKVRDLNLNNTTIIPKEGYLNLIKKDQIINAFIPPLVSVFSLILVSSTFAIFYNFVQEKENKSLDNSKIKSDSIKSINTLV